MARDLNPGSVEQKCIKPLAGGLAASHEALRCIARSQPDPTFTGTHCIPVDNIDTAIPCVSKIALHYQAATH
jgi:hypothetical protein